MKPHVSRKPVREGEQRERERKRKRRRRKRAEEGWREGARGEPLVIPHSHSLIPLVGEVDGRQ